MRMWIAKVPQHPRPHLVCSSCPLITSPAPDLVTARTTSSRRNATLRGGKGEENEGVDGERDGITAIPRTIITNRL